MNTVELACLFGIVGVIGLAILTWHLMSRGAPTGVQLENAERKLLADLLHRNGGCGSGRCPYRQQVEDREIFP